MNGTSTEIYCETTFYRQTFLYLNDSPNIYLFHLLLLYCCSKAISYPHFLRLPFLFLKGFPLRLVERSTKKQTVHHKLFMCKEMYLLFLNDGTTLHANAFGQFLKCKGFQNFINGSVNNLDAIKYRLLYRISWTPIRLFHLVLKVITIRPLYLLLMWLK